MKRILSVKNFAILLVAIMVSAFTTVNAQNYPNSDYQLVDVRATQIENQLNRIEDLSVAEQNAIASDDQKAADRLNDQIDREIDKMAGSIADLVQHSQSTGNAELISAANDLGAIYGLLQNASVTNTGSAAAASGPNRFLVISQMESVVDEGIRRELQDIGT